MREVVTVLSSVASVASAGGYFAPVDPCSRLSYLRGLSPAPFAHELAREREHEAGVVVQVARQQPARLLCDAVGPLETAVLHPGRGLRDAARVEVERGADSA